MLPLDDVLQSCHCGQCTHFAPIREIDKAVDELNARGVTTKIYGDDEVPGMPGDAKGITRDDENSMAIAWFKDPAGNVIAVMQTP